MILGRPAAEAILRHCLREHPDEACGLLVGPLLPGALPDRIVAAHASENLAADRRRGYLIDPQLHLRLQRELRGTATEVVGVYHSHPDGPAHPSARDRREAWPWFVYVIVETFTGNTGEAAAFRLLEGEFQPVPLEVEH